MAGDLQMVPLAQVAKISSGKRPPSISKEKAVGLTVPIIGGGGPSGFTTVSLHEEPVLITGRVGTLGKLIVPNGACWPSDNALVVQPKTDETDFRFLRYSLQMVIAEAAGMNRGAANPLITQGDLARLVVAHGSLSTQRAIASVLGTLDDLIELNRETNEILEEMARALFKSWFVDFDPVRAKLEGRPPAGMDAATAALFPDHFEDSELGQIPRGWEVATVSDLCEINGWTLGKRDELPRLEYVEISEVKRGEIGEMPVYRRGEEPSRARRRLRHGDTVMSTVRPDRGAYFLALNPPTDRVASTGFAVLSPSGAPWSFLHAALTQPEVFDRLGHLADGGAYPAIRPEIIGAIQIAKPDNEATRLNHFAPVGLGITGIRQKN